MKEEKILTYVDLFDALMFMVNGSNKGVAEINNYLNSSEQFRNRLSGKSEEPHFTFTEIMKMMKFSDKFDPLFYLCDELGFERPTKKAISEEK